MTHDRRPVRGIALIAMLALLAGVMAAAPAPAASATDFDALVEEILALPYNPAAQPAGVDSAFDADDYPAAFPLTDLAGGACCTGPVPDQPPLADLAPPFADFPEEFDLIELESHDGTPLHAFAALHPGAPGVVVMHGFNTNGKYSIVRYAAFLYANGYSVIAPDHRDMGREWARGGSYHPDGTRHGQTLGWKEAQDLLTAAEWLDEQGTDGIGVLGFSEGAQNTILALGIDHAGIIDTALTFSPPADQKSLAQRSPATTSALLTTVVGNGDICDYLSTVGARPEFSATANFILDNDSAVDTLDGVLGSGVTAPGLHFYTNDDTLVPPWNATLLASRTNQMANQHTVLLSSGNHAYFADRHWTQQAALTWFGAWLDPDASHTTMQPTVTATPGGMPAADQQIDLSGVTRTQGDAERFTGDLCPAATQPVGPTAILEVSGAGLSRTLDGRRSYSGWEGHEIAGWELDPGDGSPPITGSDIRDAVVHHSYRPGTYEARLTVIDDTGRTDTATETVEVDGSSTPAPSQGRVHGSGWWDRGSDDKHDKIDFSFDAKVDEKKGLEGKLKIKDKDLDVKIEAEAITSLSRGTGVDCAGVVLDGVNSFAFTAEGTFEQDEVDTPATFFACGIDHGKNKTPPADYFYVEVTSGADYSTGDRAEDNAIDGGNIHLHDPIVAPGGSAPPSGAAAAPAQSSEASVVTMDPILLDAVPANSPLTLTVIVESAAGPPTKGEVTLHWETADGVSGEESSISNELGIAIFVVTVPSGDVDYTAVVGGLESNGVRITGW